MVRIWLVYGLYMVGVWLLMVGMQLPTKCCLTSSNRAQQGFDSDNPDQMLHTFGNESGEGIGPQPEDIEAEAVDTHIEKALKSFAVLKKECEEMREEKNNFEMENQHMAADSAMQMSNYNAQMSRMVSAVSSSRHCPGAAGG